MNRRGLLLGLFAAPIAAKVAAAEAFVQSVPGPAGVATIGEAELSAASTEGFCVLPPEFVDAVRLHMSEVARIYRVPTLWLRA